MEEIWKGIKNYEELYQVSNLGNVRSLGNKTHTTTHLLKLRNKRGYFEVALCKNGKYKYYLVHRLVYEAFNGEIPEGMQVNHINENKTDNRLENLNLMTPKQNSNWGTRNKRNSIKRKGVQNTKCSKPIVQFDLHGNFIQEWPSAAEAQRQLGFSSGNICACLKGRQRTFKNYIWKYKEAV